MSDALNILKSVLHFDVTAGRCFWKRPPNNHAQLRDKEAGCQRRGRKPYWYVKVNSRPWKRAHLIFLAAHGRLPKITDHINGDSLDDRISNLREVTVTQNAWNHKARRKHSPLPMGVRRSANGKFEVRIACNKVITYKRFDNPDQAHAFYLEKRRELFGEFNAL